MIKISGKRRSSGVIIRSALVSVSTVTLGVGLSTCGALAQQASGSGANTLPPVVISPSESKQKKKPQQANESNSRTRRASQAPVRTPVANPVAAAWAGNSQNQRTGTAGYYQNSTSVATKTNTPLLNIPQSINVLTKDFIQDQSTHSVTDLTRYVPGVAVHQGEGNRDELIIRGVDSSANFYVNGFRDDVQYFRDLYNAQSVEILKGPSALTFGRGSGGGLLNRTLKEADGTRVYEASAQTGSYNDRHFTLDAGQAINENVAVRLNAFYEGSDTFRDYGHLERYGFNPTVTLQPTDNTRIKLSYEYYYDNELADRGNPSTMNASTTRFNSAVPFAPNGDMKAFFGSPTLNTTHAIVNQTMAVIDHDFGNGLTVKNSTMYADYDRGYQNVYPGGPVSSSVAPSTFPYAAYQHTTNRRNLFNQTDFNYKTWTGPLYHTITFGTEFGQQNGIDFRNTATGSLNPALGNSFDPTYMGGATFTHLPSDSSSVYRLNTQSAYAQDQMDVTRWLKLFGGARFDRFDFAATDQNTGIARRRTDDKVSPRVGVILKPAENLSVYTAYSISYLPSSGDQFSALNTGSALIPPQEFENTEVGLKWDIAPRLQYTAAIYQLNRTNVPLAIGGGLFAISGKNVIKGFETALTGYVTNAWQATLGYAYTDARIASDTSSSTASVPPAPTIVAGNRVQLVPYNQVSLWNKYQFDPQFSAGLGVIYFSDSFAASDDFVKLPGFVRFDGSLYYKFDQTWTGQLNVENIFNKGYWASADGNNNISPGQGRTFRVLARAKF